MNKEKNFSPRSTRSYTEEGNKQITEKKEKIIKRRGFFTLLFVSCYLLFVLACQNPFDPPRIEKPADGSGYLSLQLNNGRTIMPSTVLQGSLFDGGYTLVFSADGSDSITVEKNNGDLSGAITLPVGTWNLEITGYKLADDGTKLPLARGNITDIGITSGANTSKTVTLKPIVSEGQGTFRWAITLPLDITSASMTITPLDAGGSAAQTKDIKTENSGSVNLNAGIYRVALTLNNGAMTRTRERYLHIYRNMESVYTDTDFDGLFDITYVVSNADAATAAAGTLRYAVANAPEGSMIFIGDSVRTINLTSMLTINKDLVIEGNSAVITQNGRNRLLQISEDITVKISRVHFKGGNTTSDSYYGNDGGAILNKGTLTVEFCIFNNNQTNYSANGGAIFNDGSGTLTVNGCTFYQNSGGQYGGAIYNSTGGILNFTGNLFYGNTPAYRSVVTNLGTLTSGGYNVIDRVLDTNNAGWTVVTGKDKSITGANNLPLSPATFRLFSDSVALLNVITDLTDLPAVYHTTDFYGDPIIAPAAAGAVQASVEGNYYLDLSFNNPAMGTVTVSPESTIDSIYTGPLTLTAVPASGYEFAYWMAGGVKNIANPITVNDPYPVKTVKVQAVFARRVTVTNAADSGAGTLRAALNNAQDWDIISIELTDAITLTSKLPQINKSIIIEGNGAVITQNGNNGLLEIFSSVNISRVHFKGGRGSNGGAILNGGGGNLTLESCIFSDNKVSNSGGAIYNYGTLTVNGCTFYNNSASSGGAIYSGIITLTGNLFYGNTANIAPVVYKDGTVTSGGYNVVDVAYGTGDTQAGWDAVPTDKTISGLPLSGKTFKLFSGSGALNVITDITGLTARPEGYPKKDFYGNTISAGAAAGAVQTRVSGSGYYVELSLNNPTMGTISFSNTPDADGLVPSGTKLTATPAGSSYSFDYWLVDGVQQTANTLTITGHTWVAAVFVRIIPITSGADSGAGTLREALTNAQEDGVKIQITPKLTIQLTNELPRITKNITIEGNGAVITQNGRNRLLRIDSGATVNISRVHFKSGYPQAYAGEGGAIYNSGILTIESCIFSDNKTDVHGGAIYNDAGTLTVNGCTFYNNYAQYSGGVIYTNAKGIITLTGNLFYGNTDTRNTPVVCKDYGGIVTSGGYNAVDADFGTGDDEAGWEAALTDKTISAVPMSTVSFRLPSDGEATGIITTLPAGYPTKDFYGNNIPATNASAGAVQELLPTTGYYFDLSVNNPALGTVNVSPTLPSNNICTGSITLTATPQGVNKFGYWLVDGVKNETSPLIVNDPSPAKEIFIVAVFIPVIPPITVTSAADSGAGTLREALTNADDGDTININSGLTITLTSALPNITKSITINGNGAVITQNGNNRLLNISSGSAVVNINRVHFKNGGGSEFTDSGGAIKNNGTLTIESCIFSDNQTTGDLGGAIDNNKTLTVKGCTFYNNGAFTGGAINNLSATLTLTGNLFYGNTASSSVSFFPPKPVVNSQYSTVTSGGYNVVDVTYGTAATQADWDAAATDKTFSELGISGVPFNTSTFAPVSGLGSVIPSAPAGGFPEKDFNGQTRTWPGAAGAVK